MSLIRGDKTIVDYVGPSGRVYPLSGPKHGSMGVQLLPGPEGLLGPPGTPLTDGAARQHGKDYVGTTIDPVELDFEFDVWGKTPHDWAIVNRMWLDDWRWDKPGFLRFYTSDFGWRWLRVRKGGNHSGGNRKDARMMRVAKYRQIGLAEFPYFRAADYEVSWVSTESGLMPNEYLYPDTDLYPNAGGGAATVARLKAWNSGDVDGVWPQLTLSGQCSFRIRWGINDYTVPVLQAGETVVVSAEPFEQSIRSNTRNLLPALKGKYFQEALPAGVVTEIVIDILSGAGAQIQLRVPQLFERPM